MGQDGLTSIAILYTEYVFRRKISHKEVIDEFVSLKAIKKTFYHF